MVEEYHKGLSHLKDSGWENTWKKKLPLSCFHTKKAHLSILTYMCQCSLTDVFYPCSLGWMSKRVDGAAFGKTKRDGGNLSIVPRWVSCNPPYQVEGLGLIPRSHQTISTWSHDKYVTLLHVTQRTHRKSSITQQTSRFADDTVKSQCKHYITLFPWLATSHQMGQYIVVIQMLFFWQILLNRFFTELADENN